MYKETEKQYYFNLYYLESFQKISSNDLELSEQTLKDLQQLVYHH